MADASYQQVTCYKSLVLISTMTHFDDVSHITKKNLPSTMLSPWCKEQEPYKHDNKEGARGCNATITNTEQGPDGYDIVWLFGR